MRLFLINCCAKFLYVLTKVTCQKCWKTSKIALKMGKKSVFCNFDRVAPLKNTRGYFYRFYRSKIRKYVRVYLMTLGYRAENPRVTVSLDYNKTQYIHEVHKLEVSHEVPHHVIKLCQNNDHWESMNSEEIKKLRIVSLPQNKHIW